ncbi:MAG: YdcF family protein [Blautia sp.]|nr:YdcF family protein [Blautia sp.]
MKYVFWGAAVLSLLYYIVIVLYAGITASFAWFWPVLAVLLAAVGAVWGKLRTNAEGGIPAAEIGLLVILFVFALTFAVLTGLVLKGMRAEGEKDLQYVIVLGAQVRGDHPSLSLEKRLEKAFSYAEENPDTILILSGGQGPGEAMTEASCMEEWLLAHGIPKERMILEERSTSTVENLIFSDELTGCKNARTGIITNDFHVYRAQRLAERQGYSDVCGIAAGSVPIMEVHFIVREVFALLKEKHAGNI